MHFNGVINDYSPSTVSGGPWEIRGDWSLDVARSGTANFSADLTMETSDYGITDPTQVDPTQPLDSDPPHSPHHHDERHRQLRHERLPRQQPRHHRRRRCGHRHGHDYRRMEARRHLSPRAHPRSQVCIIGGSEVEFSNVTLVFTGPATTHFGPQAIHGVVNKVSTK